MFQLLTPSRRVVQVFWNMLSASWNSKVSSLPALSAPWKREAVSSIHNGTQSTMLSRNVIEPAQGPWSSPVVLVRFCVDFCKVHQVTMKDAQPLPRIDDTLDTLEQRSGFQRLIKGVIYSLQWLGIFHCHLVHLTEISTE